MLRCLTFRERVWNCFALKGNYSDLPFWRRLSQHNTLALTVESELSLGGFAGDFTGFNSLQEMTRVVSPLYLCFVFVFDVDALVKSWLLPVSKWNAILAVCLLIKMSIKRRVNTFVMFSQQPVYVQVPCSSTFLELLWFMLFADNLTSCLCSVCADVTKCISKGHRCQQPILVFSNPSSYKYRGLSPKYSKLSPSCGGMWLLQLVPYYLRTNTCKTDVIWHGNEASTWWQTSTEFWLSGGMGLPDFCYQHFIFGLLWTRNRSGHRLHSFMFADKYRSDTSLTTRKPFLI